MTLPSRPAAAPVERLAVLKTDLFGTVTLWRLADGSQAVCRETSGAPWLLRPLARALAARERRALLAVAALRGRVPALLAVDRDALWRSWLAGRPLHLDPPQGRPEWFAQALAVLTALHRAGVTHNDLAKEPNWLVLSDGSAAVIDFQLAVVHRRRGWLFRLMARDDLRHWAKHKRRYARERLTARQKALIARRSWPARLWRATVKPVYRLVTRRLLGWRDREGAGDRHLRRGR